MNLNLTATLRPCQRLALVCRLIVISSSARMPMAERACRNHLRRVRKGVKGGNTAVRSYACVRGDGPQDRARAPARNENANGTAVVWIEFCQAGVGGSSRGRWGVGDSAIVRVGRPWECGACRARGSEGRGSSTSQTGARAKRDLQGVPIS
jgi:hypothetical protein